MAEINLKEPSFSKRLDTPYEPNARYSHCSCLVADAGKWIMYGGYLKDGNHLYPQLNPEFVEEFDITTRRWKQWKIDGTPLLPTIGVATASIGCNVYCFGGSNGRGKWFNELYRLDTRTKMRFKLTSKNRRLSPMAKHRAVIVTYSNMLVIYGGFGPLPTVRYSNVQYEEHERYKGMCWTNELVCYDTEQNIWIRPTVTGSPPPACDGCTLTKIDRHRAILFGGHGQGHHNLVSPCVHILDMQHWTWLKRSQNIKETWPGARFGHAAVSLYNSDKDPESPAMVLVGGCSQGDIHNDAWVFNVNALKWRELLLPMDSKGRVYHSMMIIHTSTESRHIYIFGGADSWPPDDRESHRIDTIAETACLKLSYTLGEWMIVSVIPLIHMEEVPQHVQLTLEEEMHHLTICDRVMREKGKLELCLLQCVLSGPPRVGKSTFLRRVIGEFSAALYASQSPSTGVMEKVIQVTIQNASFVLAVVSKAGDNWKAVTLGEEAAILLKAILSSLPRRVPMKLSHDQEEEISGRSTSMHLEQNIPPRESNSANEPDLTVAAVESEVPIPSLLDVSHDSSESPSTLAVIPGYVSPIEIFRNALRSKEWAESLAQEVLGQSLNLYFSDTGGQPEFQEVLPALLSGPSVFIVIFKLNDHINQKYRVQFVKSEWQKTVMYESSFTVIETILQSLASISSMCNYVSRNSSELVPIKPKVLLVGTHKDQATNKHIKSIQQKLKETLENTEYYRDGVVVFESLKSPALTINNLSANDEDTFKIRTSITRLAQDPAFKVSVPAPWLALQLSLRVLDDPVISYEQCAHIANNCGIHSDDELKEALWFLHTKLGVIRYFHQIPELQDIVICDPQIIFSKINDLIIHTFTFERIRDAYVSETFRKKGIFPANFLDKKISPPSNKLLTNSKIISLLKHMNIIAPIYDAHGKVTHYFMACVLAHAEKSQPQSSLIQTLQNLFGRSASTGAGYIPTLCVSFCCGYCPKGIFSALAVDLMKPKHRKLQWQLVQDAIYRDQVSFEVGREHHIVKIEFLITHLAISVMTSTQIGRHQQQDAAKAKELCSTIRIEIEQSLIVVSKTLHYGSGASALFGFYCPRCPDSNTSVPTVCDEDEPVVMRCKKCGPVDLDDRTQLWFGEKMVSINENQCLGVASASHTCSNKNPPYSAVQTEILDKAPSLSELQLLKTEDGSSSVRIIETIAYDWQSVAIALGFSGPRIKNIEKDHQNRCEDASRDMLSRWLSREHDLHGPMTWATLTDCLEQAEMKELAGKVTQCLCSYRCHHD